MALLFVGLKPLWATRRAATILLWACALTVFFLNAAYKDGDPATLPRGVLRWAGRLAGPALLLLAVLAAYAIGLRIQEYGWTPGRVISSAVALMALIYGGGYAYASSPGVQWLKPLESVNVIASLVVVTMLALLLTPLADPARLSVNSQLSRLAHGAVTADTFDYQFLRFDSGIYGRRGLARLARAAGTDAGARAARMLAMKTRQYFPQQAAQSVATEAAFSHATIYPQGSRLPDDFRSADWSSQPQLNGNCLRDGGACESTSCLMATSAMRWYWSRRARCAPVPSAPMPWRKCFRRIGAADGSTAGPSTTWIVPAWYPLCSAVSWLGSRRSMTI